MGHIMYIVNTIFLLGSKCTIYIRYTVDIVSGNGPVNAYCLVDKARSWEDFYCLAVVISLNYHRDLDLSS